MNQEFVNKLLSLLMTAQGLMNDQIGAIRQEVIKLINEEVKKQENQPKSNTSNTQNSFVEYVAHEPIKKQ